MFYVIVINPEGVPNILRGPMEWDKAISAVIRSIESEKITVTDEIRDAVEMDGLYAYPDGGGVYIVQTQE